MPPPLPAPPNSNPFKPSRHTHEDPRGIFCHQSYSDTTSSFSHQPKCGNKWPRDVRCPQQGLDTGTVLSRPPGVRDTRRRTHRWRQLRFPQPHGGAGSQLVAPTAPDAETSLVKTS